MGLNAEVFRSTPPNRMNVLQGKEVCIVGWQSEGGKVVPLVGPFEANGARPGVVLVFRWVGTPRAVVHARPAGDRFEKGTASHTPTMFGGAYVSTSDSRVSEAIEANLGHSWYGAIALHDRVETWEDYDLLTR